jgi:iron complex outermembrane receptor protein
MSARLSMALCATAAIVGLTAGAKSTLAQPDQPGAASGTGLEEIVVTARRKEERVQTVPIAITAFSQKDIEEKRILQISDLAKNVPSLASNQNQSDANAFYSGQIRLRGLPGTVIYFADVPLGSVDYNPTNGITHGTSTGLFYDLDNVEVIKGPQGTLFGKNSIGGLISLEPKKPTNEFEGYGQVKFGNYSDREFEGAVNIPIIEDKVLLRIAGQSQQRDGYTKDISNGKDYDNRDYYSWRVGLTIRPTDDLENYFLYDGYYQHTNGSATIPSFYNTGFTFSQIPLPGIGNVPLTLGNGPGLAALTNPATATATFLSLLGTQAAGGQPSLSFFPNAAALLAQQKALGVRAVTGRSTPGIGKDYFYGLTNTTIWNINDDLTLKNVAAARIFKQLSSNDDNSSPLPILNIGDPINNNGWSDNSVQYTEEIQLQGKALDEKLSWVLGGFLEFDHPLGYNNNPSTALGGLSIYHFHETNRSQALFAHGIYDLGDYVSGLRLTAGYRYTWDYQSLQEHGFKNVDHVTRNPDGTPNNCAPIDFFDTNCAAGSNAHFSSYGWNVSLDEQLDPTTLLYVRAGNAYRPGGTNPQVPAAFQSIKPEHVTDVEIGAKVDWDFMGAHFRTNGDLFHSDYKAIQVQQLVSVPNPNDPSGPPTAASLETNAASATLEGAELEITVIPIEGVEISPHASYLYSHYDKYPAVFTNAETPPFFYEPKWQVGVTGTYHLPLDASIGDISFTAAYSFEGHQYVAPAVDATGTSEIFNIIPSFDNLDVRVDWTDIFGYSVDAAFFMTNALDSTHVQGVLPLFTQLGFTALVYNEPQMFGFSLKYRFGGESEPESAPAAYVPPPVVTPAPAARSYMVFFDFNKSDLTPQAASIVNQAAANAGPAKVTKLEVTGHTDTVGSDAYNMRLSRRRAESVAAQLEKDGIPSSEIEIIAKGKRDLLVPTADGVREPQNRRVQIVYEGGPTS